MIDYFFGYYLLQFCNFMPSTPITYNNKVELVIVATKTSFWLPLVINNILFHTKSQYRITFVGTTNCILFVENIFGKIFRYISIPEIKSIKDYNSLLLTHDFWSNFNTEYAFIFQPDCIILRDFKDSDFKYDYIGAVCGYFQKNNYIINGGLSMRKVSVMQEVCSDLTDEERSGNINEDIIFTKKIKNSDSYKFPSFDECMNFSLESFGNLDEAIGIHGTDKYYLSPHIKKQFHTRFISHI